jgi:hypothetical protein
MDWISAWISVSVFSSGASLPLGESSALKSDARVCTYSGGAEFSLSPAFCDERTFAVFPNIWTWTPVNTRRACDQRWTYVELPPLYVLTGLLAGDDNDELGNLASVHPVLELRHDLFDVRLDLVVGSNWVRQ